MGGGAFDVAVRAVECASCGAPVQARESGAVPCAYCGAVNVVTFRPLVAPRPAPSTTENVARLMRLATQVDNPVPGHPFDMSRAPAGVSPHATIDELRATFEARKANPQLAALKEEQRAVCWLARQLAERLRAAGEPLRARAVLETAAAALPDPGHDHILFAQLAVLASRQGEHDAARAWLGGCDPAPELLDLDSEWRLAQAELELHAGRPAVAIELLGDGRSIPIAASCALRAEVLRIAARWLGGERDPAWAALATLCEAHPDALAELRSLAIVPDLVVAREQYDAQEAARVAAEATAAADAKAADDAAEAAFEARALRHVAWTLPVAYLGIFLNIVAVAYLAVWFAGNAEAWDGDPGPVFWRYLVLAPVFGLLGGGPYLGTDRDRVGWILIPIGAVIFAFPGLGTIAAIIAAFTLFGTPSKAPSKARRLAGGPLTLAFVVIQLGVLTLFATSFYYAVVLGYG